MERKENALRCNNQWVKIVSLSICLSCLLMILLTSCSVENLIGETLGWGDASPDPDSYYGAYILALQDEIDSIIESKPIDEIELRDRYDILLMFRVNEYMFKAQAYGHFTGRYDTKRYNYLAKECNKVAEKMTKYFDEDSVSTAYSTNLQMAFAGYDDGYFDYEKYADSYPDIDKMWDEYCEDTFNLTY